jgi:hypothetical protein
LPLVGARAHQRTSVAKSKRSVASFCSTRVRLFCSVDLQQSSALTLGLHYTALYMILVTPLCVVRLFTTTHDAFQSAAFPWGVIVFASTFMALSGFANVRPATYHRPVPRR